jgi:hypothetical protein
MADLQAIIAQAGPLPIKVGANVQSDDPVAITLAGSVWAPTANSMIGISLAVDGSQAATAQIYANAPDMHMSVVPVTFSLTFSIGEHAFELDYLTGETTSDQNDFFVVTLLY